MKIFTTDRLSKLSELARQLFEINRPHAAAGENQVIAALREANPHLHGTATLPLGTALAVPDIEGVNSRPTAPSAVPQVLPLEQLGAVLSRTSELLTATMKALQAQDKADLDLINRHADEFEEADVKERLKKAKQAANARAKEQTATNKLRLDQLKTLEKDLAILSKALGK